jgi:nicotinamide phosphoribosyltransferase
MINPMLLCDGYKTGHRIQFPKGTELVYSNFTARGSRMPGVDHVVVFGIQYFLMEYLIKQFNEEFFKKPKAEVVASYKRRMDTYLGPGAVPVEHVAALHDLGYLPVKIKALPEGTLCPIRVPFLTIVNTLAEFYWVTNYLETLMSSICWFPITSATIAHQYRKLLDQYAADTSDMPEFVGWTGHDFSFRGQTSVESAMVSGAAHLLSFTGTDTIPAIDFLEQYYGANAEAELIGGSVPATEHSVACMSGQFNEAETYRRLITEVYPKGIVSIVSDTWDFYKVLNEVIRDLKDVIMARDGKVVIRPDSGNPVEIICGTAFKGTELERKGTIEILWDIFGGTVNSKGFKQLDPHIGAIYGDSITLERCQQICEGLRQKGFASTNMVFGIGSYTYQYVTRDTFGFAIKATYGIVKGQPIEMFKQPKTDNGIKNSAKGLLRVNTDLTLSESVTPAEEQEGLLETVFLDGKMIKTYTLQEIRDRLAGKVEIKLSH